MHPISSTLTSQVREFVPFRNAAAEQGFTLGGNWDYNRGSFDCSLDRAGKVWLRLPFDVTIGNLDSETEDNDAQIRLGAPYVLKHVYNEGLDKEAQPRTFGGLLDQFSDPADPDADVEPAWIDEANRKMQELEKNDPA